MTRPQHATVLDIAVDPVSTAETIEWVTGVAASSDALVAVGINAHVCNLAAADAAFRSLIARADLRYADGQSIVAAAHLLGTPLPERVATTDLILPLVKVCAQRNKRVFLYGSAPGIARRAAEALASAAPGLSIATRDGYGEAPDDGALLAAIHEHGTNVLLVGLGDPLQQQWIDAHRESLTGVAILSCGGLFDWMSGANRRAPRWMIRLGLEWLWRLILEPRRLGRRYLLGNPLFLARLAIQVVGERRTRHPR